MESTADTPVPVPSTTYLATVGAASALVAVYLFVIESALLLGLLVGSFLLVTGVLGWLGVALVGRRTGVALDRRPVVLAVGVAIAALVYSVLVEGVVLLGLLAGALVVLAGGTIGLVVSLADGQ